MQTDRGRFFEDFSVGESIVHPTPRTLHQGDATLYMALYGSRFALQADSFARALGYPQAPLDDLLVFHTVFGKSVPDISRNAVANLGYAEGRFLKPVFPGTTLRAHSEVLGLRENSNGKTGIVWIRTTGTDDHGDEVLSYVRWVMVNKRDPDKPCVHEPVVPQLQSVVPADALKAPAATDFSRFDTRDSGSELCWEDYQPGDKIDHVDGMTIEEAEHMIATRLYQNTARVHFDQYAQGQGYHGRRLAYGGHTISIGRAMSFNGLANAFCLLALNSGQHVAGVFAGDTVYCWSQIIEKAPIIGRNDCAAIRLRLIATKNVPCRTYPYQRADGTYAPEVVLDFDYWALMPRRAG
ncbi:MAG: MaoC family dehydratase [Alphaproteobacteria bacterium]|nr:MaoC family dehydratase [Alphaproteobacteria bacterium]